MQVDWNTETDCFKMKIKTLKGSGWLGNVRRCISRYRIVNACKELSSVGSRAATSWAKVNASSCLPVLCRPIAFKTCIQIKEYFKR